jgi:hypothetical protein
MVILFFLAVSYVLLQFRFYLAIGHKSSLFFSNLFGLAYTPRDDWELDDNEFHKRLDSDLAVLNRFPKLQALAGVDVPNIKNWSYRVRQLERLGVRTEEQSIELDKKRQKLNESWHDVANLPLLLAQGWINRSGRSLAVIVSLVTVVLVLPTIAVIQANAVISGRDLPIGHLGIFRYHADPVHVTPSGLAQGHIAELPSKLYFLGENAQYVIFYSAATHQTIRIPFASVIVTSDP